MGKLLDRLNKQLTTEFKQDAEDCLKIYNGLLENTGNVWESDWNPLVSVTITGTYPNNQKRFKPTSIGYSYLKGTNKEVYSKKDIIDFSIIAYRDVSNLMNVPFNQISENRLNFENVFNKTFKL